MQQAIVTVPKAALYESITMKNHCLCGHHISDELLSGWLVTILDRQGNFLKIITQYGYIGWMKESDICKISQKECGFWSFPSQAPPLLTQRLTDVLTYPKVQAPAAATLFMGSVVAALGISEEGWQKIKLSDGTLGYAPCVALAPAAQNDSPEKLRSAVISYALSYLGVQYRWGGKTHEGIDCSGLAFMSYFMCGILIYRDAAIKAGYPVKEIPRSQIRPADLLYFPGHVALYLGNGKYIHSTGNKKSFGCVINSLNPQEEDYRPDLAQNILAAGSIFAPQTCT